MSLLEILEAGANGVQLLDTRDPAEFAAAHLAGSVNVGLGGQYATWAGTVLDRQKPIALISEPGKEPESAIRLGRIGFDQVIGYLDGGLAAAWANSDLVMSTERLSPDLAAERVKTTSPPVVLDVRSPNERKMTRISGSQHIPLNHLTERLSEVPRDRPLLVYCAGGYRSSIAASLLQRAGIANVSEIAGGISAWDARRLPVQGGAEH
jgi:rhodanese-related sulfurtransferase